MKKTILFLLLSVNIGFIIAQSPKREMRAAWIATVSRIDWPSTSLSATPTSAQRTNQQNELINILDNMASNNMNAMCFQVRSRCDAMYESSYEPWSSDLFSSASSRGTNPGYDPLAFAVEEAHKRGIEVHAWINPYRYEISYNAWTNTTLNGNYRYTHPDWILTYSTDRSILNPGLPQVRDRIRDVIAEIVNKYDVDGVIMDDYFYEDSTGNLDKDLFDSPLYNPDRLTDVGAWRRQNVNKMVAAVYDTIRKVKPYVRLGMGPFGIWSTSTTAASSNGLTLPKGITGNSEYYNSKGCDAIAWLSQGSIDYISPQLYWPSSQWPSTPTPPATSAYVPGQAYESLCQWWSDVANRYGRHFYSSQIGASSPRYMDQIEIGRQIGMNREYNLNGAPGSVLFAFKTMMNKSGFFSYLKTDYYTQKSLPPAIDWKTQDNYTATIRGTRTGTVLNWTAYSGVPGEARYTVYAVPSTQESQSDICSTSQYLLGISYTNSFTLPSTDYNSGHTFIIGILDRYGNEFIDGQKMAGTAPATPMKITSPANAHSYPSGTSSVTVVWNIRLAATGFIVEYSNSPDFPDGATYLQTPPPGPHTVQFQKTQQTTLSGLTNGTYYVRVKAYYSSVPNSIFYSSDWSEPVQFTIGVPVGISFVNDDLFDCPVYRDGTGTYLKVICKSPTILNASLTGLSGSVQSYLITDEKMPAGEYTIPLSAGLPKGIYLIRINSTLGNKVVKVII